ncbi:Hypothetical protein PYTT_0577 [Akkermansia glycaniphila]|uniref:Uncharacterized protein n=1 Tax=Akkermansia glycaniphila TaxID=1679444 RepID=A0A1H6KY27_9BACT|nr:Hypothetical protein PYTT_0577 [Akkermansia glycaniphila]
MFKVKTAKWNLRTLLLVLLDIDWPVFGIPMAKRPVLILMKRSLLRTLLK